MRMFFKKSKNFGLFKLNFSKSGIGISFGIKGFRISQNSKGTYLNAGGKGFYCRKKLDSKTKQPIENTEEKQAEAKETATIYQTNNLQNFTNITLCCFLCTVILGLGLLLFKHPLRSMLVFMGGFIFMVVYCLKNSELLKELIEQGKRINELKSQNYNVEIKQNIGDSTSEEAIQKRNESKYKEYRYSYETYKKEE